MTKLVTSNLIGQNNPKDNENSLYNGLQMSQCIYIKSTITCIFDSNITNNGIGSERGLNSTYDITSCDMILGKQTVNTS